MGSINIFHGDGSALSRSALQEALAKERELGHEIRHVEGDKISPRDLDTLLSTESLFSNESLVIENLLSRLRSKDKDACLDLLSNYEGSKNILLWDKKEVTKPNLSKLPKAKAMLFKAPTELFSLLDSLVPGNAVKALGLLHQVVISTEDIVAFTMIARQISSLIVIQSAKSPKFPPWQLAKLRRQASFWTPAQLIDFQTNLLEIDYRVKTGDSKLSYKDQLDILLLNLLG